MPAVLLVLGAALIAVGAFLILPAAGLIVTGGFLFALGRDLTPSSPAVEAPKAQRWTGLLEDEDA